MSEKEPIARTAGRYVRAAGIAIKKERARLAAESEAKRAAEAAAAAQAAAQAPPPQPAPAAQVPPPVQAPPQPAPAAQVPPPVQAPPPPPQAAAPAKAPKRQAPPPPSNRFLDALFWVGFLVTIVASCIMLLSIETVLSGDTKTFVRLILTCIFFGYAIAILLNVGHAKDRVLAGITKRLWGLEHPTTRGGRFARGVAKDVLTLLGIGWLALGVLELGRLLGI